jgi:hypothetical protein
MAALETVMRIRLLLLAVVLSASPLASTRVQQGPKVLLLYDMEGVTDAIAPQAVEMGSQTYPATRESLTEDVNAAIRGLFKAGAREIVLTDGHGSGNPDPDYLLDRLPQGTRFDIRTAPYDPYIDAMDDSFDAMVAVAQRDIEAAAERALRNLKNIRPWKPAEIAKPFENQFGYVLPEQAAVASMFPHAEPVNNKTVKVVAPTFMDAYLAFRALATFTGLASQRMLVSSIRELEGGRDLISKAEARMLTRQQRTFAPTASTLDRGAIGPGRHGYR